MTCPRCESTVHHPTKDDCILYLQAKIADLREALRGNIPVEAAIRDGQIEELLRLRQATHRSHDHCHILFAGEPVCRALSYRLSICEDDRETLELVRRSLMREYPYAPITIAEGPCPHGGA